ncbi:hypothetical protein D9G85_25670 [Escherichia coli]|nr:hypothetical protein [Escherichia coli]ECU5630621.1 hypothetical protein [Salmonella enterica subsp. enterica serovar Brandenburg]EEU9219764.1 hypothetical protein [Escherichia coli]EEV9034290.1 hypothetical protein [Escherichia coli]EEW1604661.1 hypothetical protein [Escherichia coli]
MAQQRQDRRGEVQAATASATGLACFIFRFLRRPQREWDWMKMLKPMDPPPAMVTTSILKRRGDTAALTLLQDTGV